MDNETESLVISWSWQYAKENEKQIRRQIAVAQDILQENYWSVYDFFCDVLEHKARYKILRARRCQVLFLIFLPIILLEEGDSLKIIGEFISDNSLVKYMDQVSKGSGVIIDDIVIHGRGLEEVYRSIDQDYRDKEIKIWVYAKSRKAALYDKLTDKLSFSIEAFEQEWRRLSTQFVNLIYACASPYISYVESAYENNTIFQEEKIAENFSILKNTNHYQELQKETSRVLFEKGTVPSVFRGLGYDCCLRVYTSDVVQKITFIPYIFIKNTSFLQISSVIEKVCEKLPKEKAENIIHDLLKDYGDEKQGQAISYKMKLFNTLMNHIYGLYLKEQYHIFSKNSKLDIAMLAICYGEKIAWDFSRLEYQDVLDILELTIDDIEAKVQEDSELNEVLNKVNFSNSMYSEVDEKMYTEEKLRKLQEYFYENNQIDEKLAKEGKSRKQGLSLGAFYEVIGAAENIHWMSISQLNAWDSGIASCNIIYMDDGTVSSYIASGEQSFRYVLERHKKLFLDMIYAYNSPLWSETEETGDKLADKVYQQYLKNNYPLQGRENRDRKILESFMNENKDKLKDWGIPEIFA